VPELAEPAARTASREPQARFSIVYAGSLNEDCQDLSPFMDALKLLRDTPGMDRRVIVRVAGSEAVWRKFLDAARARGITDLLDHLGWLTDAELKDAMAAAGALLLIPWFPEWRQGVPSKMYEYIAFARPVLIAGHDSGGLSSLFEEWGHPRVVTERPAAIAEAISLAERGDTSRLFDVHRCAVRPQSEHDLGEKYAALAESIVVTPARAVIG
jgi:glycosyltransferase involved in cell wall biosynthesis